MIEKFKPGDKVICIKDLKHKYNYKYINYKQYIIKEVHEKGKILTVSKTVNMFGKQYLFFCEYKPKKITVENNNNWFDSIKRIEEKVIPLEASRFDFYKCFRQQELEI